MEVKDIIKKRRIELGYTLKDIADKVGVAPSTVSRWEIGDIENMRRDKIQALATALELSPNIIMGLEVPDDQKWYIEEEAKDLAKFLKSNPEYKVLFDASRKVRKDDLDKALKAVNIFVDD